MAEDSLFGLRGAGLTADNSLTYLPPTQHVLSDVRKCEN